MIKVICVGKLKEAYLKDACLEYLKRLTKYTKLELIEVSDSGINEINKAKQIEEESILKHIDSKDYLILLDLEGKTYTSVEFAQLIEKKEMEYSNITFVIGGSYGFTEHLKSLANHKISFSKLTFPHQLFRVMFLEQLYRSYKIRNNESYHK